MLHILILGWFCLVVILLLFFNEVKQPQLFDLLVWSCDKDIWYNFFPIEPEYASAEMIDQFQLTGKKEFG